MPAKKRSTPKGLQRDISRALVFAKFLRQRVPLSAVGSADDLVQILTDLDARTGRKDPSKRKPSTKGAKRKVAK